MLTFLQFVLLEDKSWSPDSTDPTDTKGWMNAKGVGHFFNPNYHHAFNPHPDVAKQVNRITHNSPLDSKERSDEGKAAINYAHKKGLARIGKKFGVHFVNFDHRAKGGVQAALYGLKALNPSMGDNIVVSHNPWYPKADKSFSSPSAAAEHIRRFS